MRISDWSSDVCSSDLQSLSVYANSHGFVGRDRDTLHSIGCALIAGQGESMQRDGWYSVGLAESDLESPAAIGRHAAQRALARLAPRDRKSTRLNSSH